MTGKERIKELFGFGDEAPDISDVIVSVGDPKALLNAPLGYFREIESDDIREVIDRFLAESKTKQDALAIMILHDVLKKEAANKTKIGKDYTPLLAMLELATFERRSTRFGVLAAYILNTFSTLDSMMRFFKVG